MRVVVRDRGDAVTPVFDLDPKLPPPARNRMDTSFDPECFAAFVRASATMCCAVSSTAVGTSSMSPSIATRRREPPAFDELGDERGERLFPARTTLVELEEHLADLGEVVADRVLDLPQPAIAPAGSVSIRCRRVWISSTAHVTDWVRPSCTRMAQRVRSSSISDSTVVAALLTHRLRRVRLFAGQAHVVARPFGRGRWF